MALQNFIDRFNNNELEFLTVFVGDNAEEEWDTVKRFLKLVEKRGMIELIRPGKKEFFYDYNQNSFNKFLFENPITRNYFIEYSAKGLWKNISYENGRIFLLVKHIEELASFFCTGDETNIGSTSYDLAYSALMEDYYEPYSETSDDIYRDVIQILTKENFINLCSLISQKFGVLNLYEYSDNIYGTIIPDLATSQGDERILRFNVESVAEMLDDSTTFNFLIKEVFTDDFESSLWNLHSNAYNGVLTDEIYRSVMKELESFGVGKGVWTSDVDKKNIYKIDITENFKGVIGEFLESHIGYTSNLEDFNNYFHVVEEKNDYSDGYRYPCLRLKVSEYPDHRKVDKYINEAFFDYLSF